MASLPLAAHNAMEVVVTSSKLCRGCGPALGKGYGRSEVEVGGRASVCVPKRRAQTCRTSWAVYNAAVLFLKPFTPAKSPVLPSLRGPVAACAPGPSSRSAPTGMMAVVADAPWLGPLSPSRAGRDADWHRGPGELGRAGAPYGVLRQGRVPTSGPTAGKRVGRTLPGHPAR
jgi:hypothetical protein